jgi:hypothetical protein
LSNQS